MEKMNPRIERECMHLFTRSTPKFTDEKGIQLPNSISVLESVEIGGVPQWLLMRGKNANNPILLYLHGGSGVSSIFLLENIWHC